MNSKLTHSILIILGLSLALGVNAAGKGKNMNNANQMPSFAQMDENNDGQITVAEFNSFKADQIAQKTEQGRTLKNIANAPTFENLDTNNDQIIDQDEFQNMPCNSNQRGKKGKGNGQNRSS